MCNRLRSAPLSQLLCISLAATSSSGEHAPRWITWHANGHREPHSSRAGAQEAKARRIWAAEVCESTAPLTPPTNANSATVGAFIVRILEGVLDAAGARTLCRVLQSLSMYRRARMRVSPEPVSISDAAWRRQQDGDVACWGAGVHHG